MSGPTLAFSTISAYGIFDAKIGVAVLDYDTFVEVKYEDKFKVSDFPVEQGSFATYNKVRHAAVCHVRLAITDDPARRGAFIEALATLAGSTRTMNIVTQDATYLNQTLESYTIVRAPQHGWGKVIADLMFIEVREVFAAYANAKMPGANGSKSSGQVALLQQQFLSAIVAEHAAEKSGHPIPITSVGIAAKMRLAMAQQQRVPGGTGAKALANTAPPPNTPNAQRSPANQSTPPADQDKLPLRAGSSARPA